MTSKARSLCQTGRVCQLLIQEKTHLATDLGIEACKNNYRTRFISYYGLVNELIVARQEKDLQRLIQRYTRYELLILDELGYIPFSKEGSELLFQVLAERYEKGSVIITTNLGFAERVCAISTFKVAKD